MIGYKVILQTPELDLQNLRSIAQGLADALEGLETVLAHTQLPWYQQRLNEAMYAICNAERELIELILRKESV